MRAATLTLVSLLVAVPLMAKPMPVSIPFTTDPDGLEIVPATVGGNPLDTRHYRCWSRCPAPRT